jgi:hypothetical protein
MAETYAGWLTSPDNTARRDVIGALARTWKQTEGSRPKRSGIAGLTSWFTDEANHAAICERSARTLTAGEIREAAEQAAAEYRRSRAATQLGLVPAEDAQQPGQAADAPGTGEILSVIYGQLSRIEAELPLIHAKLAQIAERVEPLAMILDEAGQAGESAWEHDAYGRAYNELPEQVRGWRDGLHMIHCRDDRCNGGGTCPCPCHVIFEDFDPRQAEWQQGVPYPQAQQPGWATDAWSHGEPTHPQPGGLGVVPGEQAPRQIADAGTDPATGEFVTRFADGTESRYTPQPVPPYHVALPAAISNLPPGEQRDAAVAAFREVYPQPLNPLGVQPPPLAQQVAEEAAAADEAAWPMPPGWQPGIPLPDPPAAPQPYPETEGSVADYPPAAGNGLYGGHER